MSYDNVVSKIMDRPEFRPNYDYHLSAIERSIIKHSVLLGKSPLEVSKYIQAPLWKVEQVWDNFINDVLEEC